MLAAKDIENILKGFLDPQKYFIVKIKVGNGNKIFVAVDSYRSITIDECAEISEVLTKKLDTIIDNYELEVSSPGLTQPFEVIEQYRKFKDNEVEVLMKSGEKITGLLSDTFENGFNLIIDKKLIDPETKKKKQIKETDFIEFSQIKYTKRKIKF
jgi:ribosome maturation factor RimP